MVERHKLTHARRLSEVEKDIKTSRLRWWVIYILAGLAAAGVLAFAGMQIWGVVKENKAVDAASRVREIFAAGPEIFGSTRSSILQKMGEPERVDDTVVRDLKRRTRWDQKLYRIHYDGLLIEVQRLRPPGQAEREELSQITLSSTIYKLPYELGVGMYRNRLRATLGAPTREEYDRDIYETDAVLQKQLRFIYTGDIVTSIEWRF
jgi:hypothetical protein